MTSKDRAKLKAVAANTETILQIGKNPIGDTFLKQVKDALKARELIKIHVLETCELTPYETALALAEAADCEVVQVIGSRVVLFKQRKDDDEKGSYLGNAKAVVNKHNSTKKSDKPHFKKSNFSKDSRLNNTNKLKPKPRTAKIPPKQTRTKKGRA